MRQPTPSRIARWVIGLSVTAVLTLSAAFFGLIAVVDAVAGHALASAPLNSQATATVLGIHTYSAAGEPVAPERDWAGGGGYATVDIGFTVLGEREATTIDWPLDQALPTKGDLQTIAYRSENPEDNPQLASAPGPDPFAGASDQPSWPVSTAVIMGLLAVMALIGTVFWALAVPGPSGPAFGPPPGWPQPQPGWPQPQPGWGQPSSGPPPGWPQLTAPVQPEPSRLSTSSVLPATQPPPPGLVPPS